MNQNAPIELMSSFWWRFDRYELTDGVIRPASDANFIEYRPWGAYKPMGDRRKRSSAPYASLLELLPGELDFWRRGGTWYSPTSSETRRITDWCARFGLLGVLLHRVDRVVLYPRWERVDPESRLVAPSQSTYLRTTTGWVENHRGPQLGKHERFVDDPDELHGSPVGREVASDWPPPNTRIRPLDPAVGSLSDYDWHDEPLYRTWHRFFRNVAGSPRRAETTQYPPPLSPGFWEVYQEPLADFIAAATVLRSAIEWAQSAFDRTLPEANRWRALYVLRELVSGVHPAPVLEPTGDVREGWFAPSLLGSLAYMALRDLTGGGRPRQCARCGATFVSKADRATYCSERCRAARKKARQRKEGPSDETTD